MADENRLGRDYVLHEEIGRTPWAVMRRATALADGSEVVAKILRAEFGDDREVRGRLLQEETVLRNLRHEAIVQVHDLVADRGLLALVLEYVDGVPLGSRVAAWSVADARAIGASVAAALAAAHEAGVPHLGLTPGKILIIRGSDPPGVKITGFGVGVAERNPYSAPEIDGETPPTAAADVFSLGAILSELAPDLAGELADCAALEPDSRPPAADLAARLSASREVAPDENAGVGVAAAENPPAEETVSGDARDKATTDEVAHEKPASPPMELKEPAPRPLEIERTPMPSAVRTGPELSEPPADRWRRRGRIAALVGLVVAVSALSAVWIGLNTNSGADVSNADTPSAPSGVPASSLNSASTSTGSSATASASAEALVTLPPTRGDVNDVAARQCVRNSGTDGTPQLKIVKCLQGSYYVLRRFNSATSGQADAEEKCSAVVGYTKWYFYDSESDVLDFVLCLREMPPTPS